MKDGFIRVAAATPEIQVADCGFNRKKIEEMMREACRQHVRMMVFPELCMTGYTCGDLFLQELLLRECVRELGALVEASRGMDMLTVIGMPLDVRGKLYNTAVVLKDGQILGVIPKTFIPNYAEFYEARYFERGFAEPVRIKLAGQETWFGTHLLFECENIPGFVVGGEICEDLWAPNPPSISHALAGATVLFNVSASNEVTGKDIYRKALIGGQSARLICGYVYAGAGEGESTTDVVFPGHSLICENGICLAESKRFETGFICGEVDLGRLNSERRRMTTFIQNDESDYIRVPFCTGIETLTLQRFVDPKPFVPSNDTDRKKRCEEILSIQAMGLKKRLAHTHCQHAVVGISGGLDSTLALLVTVRAFDALGLHRGQIKAVTMPCFGTTDRTYNNACQLVRELGAELLEVNIREAVSLHFRDIGQNPETHDVTYENSQARERTQVLMDLANQCGGMVIGTGDMSELALGWATYNGDHMSMYGVNASVPKTLVRHLVQYYADTCSAGVLRDVLLDILDTPVSPELIPPKEGEISQKTEDLVGPYELHDFYLYYMMRFGYAPVKIYRLACIAFKEVYAPEEILKWLKKFYHRFFVQQFKRSCVPDGPKVGSVALSPRGDWRMPSDASVRLWKKELEELSI
ncbi:NAD(+) synthase [Frisingicoccus sp.]|uniref:NAD(+) synthase n=1 Tax=Frisingicoccus sp. TaxID=1918627 RepID=UPI002E761C77|nr:NAD(+) synthase [Frisingicoccus sp.]MEE0751972.1 NAD(+) synthase [Frisingicoccus sp.]